MLSSNLDRAFRSVITAVRLFRVTDYTSLFTNSDITLFRRCPDVFGDADSWTVNLSHVWIFTAFLRPVSYPVLYSFFFSPLFSSLVFPQFLSRFFLFIWIFFPRMMAFVSFHESLITSHHITPHHWSLTQLHLPENALNIYFSKINPTCNYSSILFN